MNRYSLHDASCASRGISPMKPLFTLKDLVFSALAVAFVLACLAWGEQVDDLALQQEAELEYQRMATFDAGRLQGRKELLPSVSRAYSQGQRDAMLAVRSTPGGIALAQACLAQGGPGPQPMQFTQSTKGTTGAQP